MTPSEQKTGVPETVDARPSEDRTARIRRVVDEFLEHGEDSSQTVIKRHPELMPELAEELRKVELVRRARQLADAHPAVHIHCPHCQNAVEVVSPPSATDELSCPSCGSRFQVINTEGIETVESKPSWGKKLGRFEFLERLGTGAFGTVYKARDPQLDRTVAVKIPRNEHLTDHEQRQFLREARAAAQLRHPNIVSVYEVGRDGGTAFIVSDFIEGVDLADWLSAKRLPVRDAVAFCLKIANALHHAHQAGVVHRDLKPANIMLDANGEPFVMDFGLAKRETGEITMTLDGSILGTPAYMSPEQARGEAHQADRRSDVYSLGVILFELCTGERPFRGNSRMLLHQVLNDDAPSPRKFNNNVPRDLETICLKCLEKEPARRYSSAQELADELQRFLNGEVIYARPIRWPARLWRWCKRKPVLAGSISLSTAVIVISVTVAFLMITSALRREQAAHSQAVERFVDARRTVDLSLTRLSEALKYYPGQQVARKRLLEQAAADYEEFTRQDSNDPDLELERGRASLRLGDVRRRLGEIEPAEQAFQAAAAIFAALEGRRPEAVVDWGNSQVKLGTLWADTGQQEKAEAAYRQAIDRLDEFVIQQPEGARAQDARATGYLNLAVLQLVRGDHEDAEQTIGQSIHGFTTAAEQEPDEPRYREGLATARTVRGRLLAKLGRYEPAERELQQAVTEFDALTRLRPNHPQYVDDRASARIDIANILRTLGDEQGERAAYQQAIDDYVLLNKVLPDAPPFVEKLALTYTDLGQLLYQQERIREARTEFERALPLFENLALDSPDIPRYHQEDAVCRDALAQVLLDLGKVEAALQLATDALATFEWLLESFPSVPEYRLRRAITYSHLAQLQHKLNQAAQSQQSFQKAVDAVRLLTDEFPEVPAYRQSLAEIYWKQGHVLHDAGHVDSATVAFRKAIQSMRKLSDDSPSPTSQQRLAWFLTTCPIKDLRDPQSALAAAESAVRSAGNNARFRHTLAVAQLRTSDWSACATTLQEVIKLRQRGTARDWFVLAMAHHQMGDHNKAKASLKRGVDWMDNNRPGHLELLGIRREAERMFDKRMLEKTTNGDKTRN